ncbi:MAG: multicopper oxidase domain-containing protein [Candidatus Solibacter usitatus]|nr:multicopper oxidase domain-containing protein [Candidatus Solibacter usitatus]
MYRRQFIQTGAGAAAMLAAARQAHAFSNSPALRKFVQPLPGLGPSGIPVATPDTTTYSGVDYYKLEAASFRQRLHPDLPASGTRLYGYADLGGAHGHLGGVIVAQKGRPVRINFTCKLPASHILPFDTTLPMGQAAGEQPRADRAAVHLHGGLVPWASDGGPFHWVANAANPVPITYANKGASCVSWLPDATGALTNDLWYPNNQSARLMWYHDHAMGITRLNAHASLASAYLLVDTNEAALFPSGPGIPLIIQDKTFWDPAKDPLYANQVPGVLPGDLWYPYLYEPKRWKVNNSARLPLPVPSCVPEYFADTMLVNGDVYPFLPVDRGSYRFRILNACNARFMNLTFVYADATGKEPLLGATGLPVAAPVVVQQVGTEGGFLPAPVRLFSGALPTPLLLGPGERADIVVDFSACASGANVLLHNDAPAPYPMGAPVYDYFVGAAKNPVVTLPGYGPNSRTLMQFQVSAIAGPPVPVPASTGISVLPTMPDAVNGGLKINAGALATAGYGAYTVVPAPRNLTLNETFDANGRLLQLVGTNAQPMGAKNAAGFGRMYMDPPTENLKYGNIEIWQIFNLTADAHPMHVHLVNAVVLGRRPFQTNSFNGTPNWMGPARGPDANETGWKETIKMYPGECTIIAVLVEQPLGGGRTVAVNPAAGVASVATLPPSPRPGVTGDEYVWHCHILEHEEHDMMRPLMVT